MKPPSTLRDSSSGAYPKVNSQANFPEIERKVLQRWETQRTFNSSVEQRSPDQEFVFYDGPPFANGLPHHGHLLTGYVKDVIPRYKTMRGYRVNRRFGWDCHGLPAEMETERELGVGGHAAIQEYGVDRFNAECRKSVLRYTEQWRSTVTRQARWVDFENDYKTMNLSYMESVMWAFRQLWDKGLIYQAFRVMPYSWGAETPLSNFEIRLDDSTRPRQDPALTVWFELSSGAAAELDNAALGDAALAEAVLSGAGAANVTGPLRLLAWTTTPWTLPSNLALAVGADIDYAVVSASQTQASPAETSQAQASPAETSQAGAASYVLAAALVDEYESDLTELLGEFTISATVKGHELVGLTYQPMFDYFAHRRDAFRVLAADFVDTTEGTGIVHMAPGFGEDDQLVCEANGIEIADAVPVDDKGCFTEAIAQWSGQNVFDANAEIIAELKARNRVLRHATYEHNYPHCWRTDTPIIYKAISSWFVKVTDIRDRLGELNQDINWVPEHVRDGRFGQWLAGARDWSISRNRFWGSPIPIWVSDNPDYPRTDVYGSLDEIEADFGIRPNDLHRPFIDELTRPNPDDPTGKSTMRRVPEVLDCWFESGSMPFAQVHYPFENKEWFEQNFPADFIVEYINQTRGWFYTLHVLAGALFDQPAFENVICHGILLAGDGNKLSKRLRNYTEPAQTFDTQGSDALRWYLMSTNIVRGGDTRLSDVGIAEVTRQVLIPIWNAYSFFTLYANADRYTAKTPEHLSEHAPDHVLDRYLLAKTRTTLEAATKCLDAYDLPGAAAEMQSFVGALNNWYIRRSRDRFWGTQTSGTANNTEADATQNLGDPQAFDTLFTVLVVFAKMAAPLLPLIMDEIHTGLTGGQSVHLADWPDPESLPGDEELVRRMEIVREVASAGLRLREDAGLRVRLPLSRLTVAGPGAADLEPLLDLLTDELNVRSVALMESFEEHATKHLRLNGAVLGPRLGEDAQSVFAAAKKQDWRQSNDGTVLVAGHELLPGEYELALRPTDDTTSAALSNSDLVVVLDTEVTPDLAAEGDARDLIRVIQQARKDAGLDVTDRIALTVSWSPPDVARVQAHKNMIAANVLAVDFKWLAGTAEPVIDLERAK